MPAGKSIIIPNIEKKYVLSSDAVKFVPNEHFDVKFLNMAINSTCFKKQVYEDVTGVTRVRTSLEKLKTYLLPLPPLAEQERIVAKIEELNKHIEKL